MKKYQIHKDKSIESKFNRNIILHLNKKIFLSLMIGIFFTSNAFALDNKSNFEQISKPEQIVSVINVGDKNDETPKNPFIASGLSFVIPGAGQIYNEEYLKGVLLFVGVIGLAALDFFVIEPNAKSIEQDNLKLPEAQRKNNSLFDLGALITRISLPTLWVYNWGSAYQSSDLEYQKKIKLEEEKKNKQEKSISNNIINIKLVKINF